MNRDGYSIKAPRGALPKQLDTCGISAQDDGSAREQDYQFEFKPNWTEWEKMSEIRNEIGAQ